MNNLPVAKFDTTVTWMPSDPLNDAGLRALSLTIHSGPMLAIVSFDPEMYLAIAEAIYQQSLSVARELVASNKKVASGIVVADANTINRLTTTD
jgi:hypothetical protein